MKNTHINSYEKVGEKTMRKNQIRKALIDLGFKKIEGWMFSSGNGKNRYHALGRDEVRKALDLLTKVYNFDDTKIIKTTMGDDVLFSSVSSDGHMQYLHADCGYVDFEFIDDTFHSVIIKYEDFNYGWQEEELY